MWPGQLRASNQAGMQADQNPVHRQIASLHEHYPSRVNTNENGTKYEIALLLGPQHVPLLVSIELPVNFPAVAPEFRVKDPKNVTHPWIQSSSESANILRRLSMSQSMRIVGHPSLAPGGWRGGYDITIGQILRDIEAEFNYNIPRGLPNAMGQPPAALPQFAHSSFIPAPSPFSGSAPVQSQSGHFLSSSVGSANPAHSSTLLKADVTAQPLVAAQRPRQSDTHIAKHASPEFPEVENITFAQLRAIMEDDVRFEQFFEDTQAAKDSRAAHDELVQTVMSQARQNIDIFGEISELKNQLYDLQGLLKIEEAELQSFTEANRKAIDRHRPEGILAAMESEISVLESAADALYDAFCRGEIDTQRFTAEYAAARVDVGMYEATALKFRQLISE